MEEQDDSGVLDHELLPVNIYRIVLLEVVLTADNVQCFASIPRKPLLLWERVDAILVVKVVFD
jgi:hypothetical protein